MEDDMKNRVVDISDADREEKKPLKQRPAIVGLSRVFEARACDTAAKTSPTRNKVSVKLWRKERDDSHATLRRLPTSS
jgi:hypothetical protein